jgi:hypothetical protein
MSWLYGDEIINEPPEGVIGFIYLITNLSNGKKYIGKKLFLFSKVKYKTVKLKNGKKKRKKIKSKVNSDWQNYWSSSEELKTDVKNLGTDNFKREILRYCYSKNELSYYEAKYQFENDVLLNEDLWYNRWISVKVRKI